jgi:hypothetical protein
MGFALLAVGAYESHAVEPKTAAYHRYILKADRALLLNPPHGERFDASGLLRTSQGEWLTVNDRGPELYRIVFTTNDTEAALIQLTNGFTTKQLAPLTAQKHGRYDSEGIAQDEQGRIYVCEESDRWILRWDPLKNRVDRLAIDWSPVARYFSADPNASFEGITVGGNRLYVANERQLGVIIVIDLDSLKIIDHFVAQPPGHSARDVHYSDLCWFDGALYALLRESSLVLKIDPATHRPLAEYNFRDLEEAPGKAYRKFYPTSVMEGLYVERDYIWLVTDNNGLGRVSKPFDSRPTLFRCPNPKN